MSPRPINIGMLILLLMFSFAVDIFQLVLDLIPMIGWIINVGVDFIVGWIFFLWFKIIGVKYTKRTTMAFIAGFILDLIPYIDTLAWTIDVIMIYASTHISSRQLSNEQSQENYKFNRYQQERQATTPRKTA